MRAVIALLLLTSAASADRVMDPELQQEIGPRPQRRRPQPPPVAPDIAQLGTKLAGTYGCGAAGKLVVSLGLDNAWLEYRFERAVEYRSYDAIAKQWTRLRLASDGSVATSMSLGPPTPPDAPAPTGDGEWTWASSTGNEREVIAPKAIELAGVRCTR